MATTSGLFGRILWRSVIEIEWLVFNLVPFFEDGGFDIHSLWLLALEDDMVGLRTYVEGQCNLSLNHARNFAMVLPMWTALLKLPPITGSGPVGRPRLQSMSYSSSTCLRPTTRTGDLRFLSMASGLPQSKGGVWSAKLSRSPQPFVMYAAARRGHLESVVWLHYFSDYDQARALDEVATHGHTNVVAWLLDSPHPRSDVRVDFRIRDDPELGVMAWRTGRMFYTVTREWGVEKSRFRYSADALAAKCGDLQGIQKFLAHELFGAVFDFRVTIAAASAGQLGVLEFLQKHCPRVFRESDALVYAVQNGNLGVAKWLVANATCKTIDGMRVRMAAITRGDLHILEWMKKLHGCRGGGKLSALPNYLVGDLSNAHSLVWLVKEQNLEVTSADAEAAIARHDLELTSKAIKEGNLELVRWFIEDHNVWSPSAFSSASKGPSVGILEYVYQRLLQRNALDIVGAIEHNCSQYHRTLGMCEHDPRVELSDLVHRRHMECSMCVVGMLIDVYDPAFLRRATWLPMWALQQRSLVSLERLAEVGRPTVFSPKLFRCLFAQYRNESIVRWFIEN